MEIFVAKTAGFCFGVKRAIQTVNEKVKEMPIVTYGPLIHNKIVIDELAQKGVRSIEDLSESDGETVVLRSHGVPPKVIDYLESEKKPYIDCTCPFVKKIHRIVEKNFQEGIQTIILGDTNHPEIIGIFGYTNDTGIMIKTVEDVHTMKWEPLQQYCVVAQTTFDVFEFQSIIQALEQYGLNLQIYNTICDATKERQQEAEELSQKMDKMIVLGDKKSSNTKKLYEISKKNCQNTYLIESIDDLELNIFSSNDKIGLTAGASTPPGIIKEAIITMSELNKDELTFEEMLDQSFTTLHTGEIVRGTVIRVSNGEIFVNLGYKSDGIVTRDEFSDDSNLTAESMYQPGDEIEVVVLRINDGDGNVLISRKRMESQKGLSELEQAFKEKTVVRGKVVDVVKGGLMTSINGVRVFVPSSQISSKFVDDLKPFVGKEYDFNILEFDLGKRRIVAGRKEIAMKEEQQAKQKILETFEEGMKLEGTVRRIVDFGAFVDLGGIDGLVHISELSWGRVKKVTDVVKVGDRVTVTILEFNKEKGKVSLSLKDVHNDPWSTIEERYPIGAIVSGKVVRMSPFGAFVELEEGVDGLVHISQISTKHVAKPEDELKIGEVIQVKITDIDTEKKRISLSKKEVDEPTAAQSTEEAASEETSTENE